MYATLSGIVGALGFVAATLFVRAFARGRDPLFLFFAAAFAILGATQLVLGIQDTPEVNQPLAVVPRLLAAVLILFGIADKNRSSWRTAQRRYDKVTVLRAAGRR